MDILVLVVIVFGFTFVLVSTAIVPCPLSSVPIVLLLYCSVHRINTGLSLYWSLSVSPITEAYVFLSLCSLYLYLHSCTVTRYACYLGIYQWYYSVSPITEANPLRVLLRFCALIVYLHLIATSCIVFESHLRRYIHGTSG